jgi:hypothetical protein
LCEEAKQLIFPQLSLDRYRFLEIDIADSPQLVEEYGVSIPVLMLAGKQLMWPFTSADIEQLLGD